MILFLIAVSACGEGQKHKPDSSDDDDDSGSGGKKPRASASAGATAAASGVIGLAKGFTERVCTCKDADCGQKVLDQARETMPAAVQSAAAADRAIVDDERKKAFACMDKLVANDPGEKKAIDAAKVFATAICACADASCVDGALRDGKKAYDDATNAPISKAGSATLMGEHAKMTKCLETISYKGSTVPGIGASADAMVKNVCACKDSPCADAALRAGGRVFSEAFTPDDLAVVRAASKRASECVGKLPK